MLSRLAENLYWCGVYIERSDETARLLDVTYHSLLESRPSEVSLAWRNVLEVLYAAPSYGAVYDKVSARRVLEHLITHTENPSSILSTLTRARENARSVREVVPSEFWESVNDFYLDIESADLEATIESAPFEIFRRVRWRSQAVVGTAAETMLRDDGWRFFMLGRMLERSKMICRLLYVEYGQLVSASGPTAFHHWVSVLKSASAFEAFRKTYSASMDPTDVVEFLILSPVFPRSVLWCLRSVEHELDELSPPDVVTLPRRLLGRVRADLEYRNVEEILDEDLHTLLSRVQNSVDRVAETVAETFFRNVGEGDFQQLGIR